MKSRKKYETRQTVIELLIYDAINSDAKMGYVNLDTLSFQINQNSLEIFVPAQPLLEHSRLLISAKEIIKSQSFNET